MDRDEAKRAAARAALDLVPEEGVIGLGTGSTAALFIDAVGELVRQGRKLVGVPTSQASREQAERLGIPLLPDSGPWTIDVCVDGADEVSESLDLIKGGGGALTREKIVNRAAKMNVIVVDDSKLSRHLGEKWRVPVEVLPFGRLSTRQRLEELGAASERLRDGKPFVTDSGNYIYDVAVGVIEDAAATEARLGLIPGVVESGLFVGRTDVLLVAGPGGVRTLTKR